MNGNRILAGEFAIALAISSWAAMRDGWWPWPGTVIKTGIAFSILGFVAMVDESFAALLGGGFLLADVLRVYQTGKPFLGGVPGESKAPLPEGFTYFPLQLGGTNKNVSLSTPGSQATGAANTSPTNGSTMSV